MLLIKRLGGSLEEQIAGLLHDVSHTAFSHVVDFALDYKEEDYHEKIYEQIISKSEIPSILEKHGFNYEAILLDDSKWTILEQPAPGLCADRVDYTLRDMYEYGHISLEEVHRFLDHLIVVDGKMSLNHIETAEWFVKTYYMEVIDFFMDPLNIYGYDILAKALRIALNNNTISLDDLLHKDEEVMTKLRLSDNEELQALIKQLHYNVHVIEDNNDYDIHRKNKLRLIDPTVLIDNELKRASELSHKVKQMGEDAFAKATIGTYVKVVSN